MDHEVEYLRLR